MFWLFCSIRKTVIQTFWMLIRTCGSCLLSVCCPVCGAALVLSDHWMMTWSLRLRKAQGNQILNCYITAHSESIQNVIQILLKITPVPPSFSSSLLDNAKNRTLMCCYIYIQENHFIFLLNYVSNLNRNTLCCQHWKYIWWKKFPLPNKKHYQNRLV